MIIDELIKYAAPEAGTQVIKDIRIGLGYTCVELSGGGCGLAYTFRRDAGHTCSVLGTAGTLLGLPVSDTLTWARSDNKIKAALGLATINALINRESPGMTRANVADALEVRKQDTFGMVGAFRPILKEIRSRVGKIYVFEEDIEDGNGYFSSDDIPVICQVAMSSFSPLRVLSTIRSIRLSITVRTPGRSVLSGRQRPCVPLSFPDTASVCWREVWLRIPLLLWKSSVRAVERGT